MSDPTPDPNDKPDATPATDPIAVARQIADSIKQGLADAVPQFTAPPAPAPKPDPRESLTREAGEVNRRFDELMAEGKFAEAMAVRDSFAAKAAATLQGDPTDSPTYKTALSLAKRVAKSEHSDVFKRWGTEVEAEINRLPAEQRMLPESWDRAVRDVKAAHFDEILAEQRKSIEEDLKKSFITAPQGGARGAGRSSEDTYGLSAEELAAADFLEIDPKAFAAQKKLEDIRPPGQFEGYYVMQPTKNIEPGRF